MGDLMTADEMVEKFHDGISRTSVLEAELMRICAQLQIEAAKGGRGVVVSIDETVARKVIWRLSKMGFDMRSVERKKAGDAYRKVLVSW